MEEVARGIADKLISRHPYVFATAEVPVDLHYTWEQRKAAEKGRTSALQGIPEQLSALARANKIISRARSRRVGSSLLPDEPTTAEEVGARSWRWPPALRRPESTRSRRFAMPYAALEAQVRHRRGGAPRRNSGLDPGALSCAHVRATDRNGRPRDPVRGKSAPQNYPPQNYPPQNYPPQNYPPQNYPPAQPELSAAATTPELPPRIPALPVESGSALSGATALPARRTSRAKNCGAIPRPRSQRGWNWARIHRIRRRQPG